jgi:hypothetical protein
MGGLACSIAFWRIEPVSIKEIAIWAGLLVLGYWLGKSGALSQFLPGA